MFTDLECRTFSQNYYPDYVIRTVPHQPWQKKPIRLPQSRCEEVMRIMKEQMRSGKYEPSSASYRSTIWDATLPPCVNNMIESFSGRAIYGLFDLKSGYDSQILATISRDLTSFYVEGMGLLWLTRLPQGHMNLVVEFQ